MRKYIKSPYLFLTEARAIRFLCAGLMSLSLVCTANESNFESLSDILYASDLLTPAAKELKIQEGIPYCNTPIAGLQLKLDLLRPSTPSTAPTPAVVMIHGGGLIRGIRSSPIVRIGMKLAASKGYLVVSPSYRLTSTPDYDDDEPDNNIYQVGARFPDPIQDINCAVRWLKDNAKLYNVDPDKIAVTGGSAGGYLGLMNSFAPDKGQFRYANGDWKKHDLTASASLLSSKGKVLAEWFGPKQMNIEVNLSADRFEYPAGSGIITTAFEVYMGCSPTLCPVKYNQASPLTYITGNSIPTQTLHGVDDSVVPVQQAQLLGAKAESLQAPYELYLMANTEHAFMPTQLIEGNPLFASKLVANYVWAYEKFFAFLKQYDVVPAVAPTCTSFTYAWSTCSNQIQYSTVLTSSPAGCIGGNPERSRSCTEPCTGYNYSAWSPLICPLSGIQTRTIQWSIPLSCSGGVPAEPLQRSCSRR